MGSFVVLICIIISSVFLLTSIILGYELEKMPFGVLDFQRMVEEGRLFVDKTQWIKDVITLRPDVLLVTRPPKTGSSINLSMLRIFLDRRGNSTEIFQNTSIAKHPKFCLDYQNKYPVIYLTFRNYRAMSYHDTIRYLSDVFANLYETHRYVMRDLADDDLRAFLRVLRKPRDESEDVVTALLYKLIKHVRQSCGKKVYVIIDGYDAIVYENHKTCDAYYFPQVSILEGLLFKSFSDNTQNIEMAILTGLAPVVEDGIPFGLKSALVDSVLKPVFPYSNGFTDAEVKWLVKESGKDVNVESLRTMYGGYMVGSLAVYNPYSVTLSVTLGREEPFWAEAVSMDLIYYLLQNAGPLEKMNFEKLLSNFTIQKPLHNNLVFGDLRTDVCSFWTVLVHAGFLSAVFSHTDVHYFVKTDVFNLTIPNMDVHRALMHVPNKICSVTECDTASFYNSLKTGRVEAFYKVVSKFFERSGCYHEWGPQATEKDYHTFMSGMIRMLDEEHYRVMCNYKSGPGRYDIVIFPTDSQKLGIVFGFKKAAREKYKSMSLAEAAEVAMSQVLQKPYLASFAEKGIKEVLVVGMSFFTNQTAMNCTVVPNAENFDTSRLAFTYL